MARYAEEWMRSLEVGHVLPCPSLESSGGRTMSGGSGARSREPFAKREPDGSLAKMFQVCWLPGMGPPPEKYSGAWPNSGSLRNGCFYLRQPWVRPSKGSDSGSWPTCRTGGANRNSRAALTNRKGHAKGKSDLGLEQAADVFGGVLPEELESVTELPPQWQRLWPTATAGDHKGSGNPPGRMRDGKERTAADDDLAARVAMWPTPDAQTMNDGTSPEAWAEFCRRSKEKHNNGNGHGTTLAMATTLWQTPTAKCSEDSQTHRSGDRTDELLLTGQAKLWATPTTQDSENDGPPSQAASSSPPLNAQVGQMWLTPHGMAGVDASGKEGSGGEFAGQATRWAQEWGETPTGLWPTPNAEEATGYMSGSNRDTWRPTLSGLAEGKAPVLHQGRPSSLPDPQTETPGVPSSPMPHGSPQPSPRKRLNPKFVEWLMGLPPGWVTGRVESISFACWEMESSRRLVL